MPAEHPVVRRAATWSNFDDDGREWANPAANTRGSAGAPVRWGDPAAPAPLVVLPATGGVLEELLHRPPEGPGGGRGAAAGRRWQTWALAAALGAVAATAAAALALSLLQLGGATTTTTTTASGANTTTLRVAGPLELGPAAGGPPVARLRAERGGADGFPGAVVLSALGPAGAERQLFLEGGEIFALASNAAHGRPGLHSPSGLDVAGFAIAPSGPGGALEVRTPGGLLGLRVHADGRVEAADGAGVRRISQGLTVAPDAAGAAEVRVRDGEVAFLPGNNSTCEAAATLSPRGLSSACGRGLVLEARDPASSGAAAAVALAPDGHVRVAAAAVELARPSGGGDRLRVEAAGGGGFRVAVLGDGVAGRTTKAGEPCQFPMEIGGREHHECVPYEGGLYCVDASGEWAECAGEPAKKLAVEAPGGLALETARDLTLRGAAVRVTGTMHVDRLVLGDEPRVDGFSNADGRPALDAEVIRSQRVQVSGNAELHDATVAGALRTHGRWDHRGPAHLHGEVAFEQAPTFAAGLRVAGELEAAGPASFRRGASVAGGLAAEDVRVAGSLRVEGAAEVASVAADVLEVREGGTLSAPAAAVGALRARAVAAGGLDVAGAGRVGGNLSVGGDLRVANGTLAASNAEISGTLKVARLEVAGEPVDLSARAAARAPASTPQVATELNVTDNEVRAARLDARAVATDELEVRGGLTASGTSTLGELAVARIRAPSEDAPLAVEAEVELLAKAFAAELEVGKAFPAQFDAFPLRVGGSALFAGAAFVADSVAIGGNLSVAEGTVEARDLAAETLAVQGQTVLAGGLTVLNETLALASARVGGGLTVQGEAAVGGGLRVRGKLEAAEGLAAPGLEVGALTARDAEVSGKLVVDELVVTGAFHHRGAAEGNHGRAGRGLLGVGQPVGGYVEVDASGRLGPEDGLVAIRRCGLELVLPRCAHPGQVVRFKDVSGTLSFDCPVYIVPGYPGQRVELSRSPVKLTSPLASVSLFCAASEDWFLFY